MARLGDLGEIITGNTPKTSESENYASDDICFVKPSDISDGNITRIERSEFYISEYARKKARILPPGSVLVTCIGIIGKVAINSVECACNQQINAIIPDYGKCTSEYLAYALQSRKRQLQSTANAPVVPIINKSRFSDIIIPTPTISQQKYISAALEKVSDLIRHYKQQLTKLDELVKARFVEMFGDPVANSRAWPKQQLGDNVTLLNGRAYQQDELLRSGKYPVLRVGNFFSNRDWYYSDLELEDNKYCYKGDLLYAWSASFGPRIWDGEKTIYHYHIWKVIINRGYDKIFLLKLLENTTATLKKETHGIAMMHLTKIGMEQTEFIVPALELQQQFAAFVTQVEKSKAAVQSALDKAQLLFDSLMQKYFG